jgi:phosphate transport system protein
VAKRFDKEIDKLKRKILGLSAIVEESFHKAISSLERGDEALASQVVAADRRIDDLEVEVEEECLKILALYQPVAVDLRYIVVVLKLNNDLERIGDLAVNIAEQAGPLKKAGAGPLPERIPEMATCVDRMLAGALDSLVNMDANAAWQVCAADDRVDELHRGMYAETKDRLKQEPENVEALIHLLSVSRYLERIADHATNIAEDVIYLLAGDIIRRGGAPDAKAADGDAEKPSDAEPH